MKLFKFILEPINRWLWSFLCKRHLILFCSSDAPDPVDPGKSMGQYLFGKKEFKSAQGVTDPLLQGRLLESEATFRPLYTALELADIQTMAQGRTEEVANPAYEGVQRNISSLDRDLAEVNEKGQQVLRGDKRKKAEARKQQLEKSLESISPTLAPQAGLFDLLEDQSRRAGDLQREQLQLQRESDVGALQEFAPQVVEAYRGADPYSTGLAEQQTAMAEDLYQRSQGLNPEQQRLVDQQALGMAQRQGRVSDQSAIAGQLMGREQYLSGLRREAAGMGQQAFAQNRNLAGDVGMTILGRPSAAVGLGGSMLGQAQQGAAGPMGPQLFDPNAGINMALQQRGQDMTFQGMQDQAKAAMIGGVTQAFGSMAGAAASGGGGCWVAREVYGIENPQWLEFREWMLNDAPSWLRNLYLKYGERFAKFISNKPRVKLIIRKWMNTKIK